MVDEKDTKEEVDVDDVATEEVPETDEEGNVDRPEAADPVVDEKFVPEENSGGGEVIQMVKPVLRTPLASTNALAVRDKIEAFCKENGLDYMIAGGRFTDDTEEQKNLTRLFFHSELLGEATKDSYVLHQWLMKTGLDIVNYARRVTDQLVHTHQLITIPASKVKPVSDAKLAEIEEEIAKQDDGKTLN